MTKQRQLFLAIGLGLVALVINKAYLDSRISDLTAGKKVKVLRATARIEAGTPLSQNLFKVVTVPEAYAPKDSVNEDEIESYKGNTLALAVAKDDYILESFFEGGLKVSGGNRLSDQIQNDQLRALTIPVDETNSLARSLVAGDRIDIQFSVSVPGAADRASLMFLQDVPVLATGTFSPAVQEGVAKANARYSTATLLLPVQDAMRLSFARQAGQITILLRGAKSSGMVEVTPIAGVKDILTQQQREVFERMAVQTVAPSGQNNEQIRSQLKELLDRQRTQERK